MSGIVATFYGWEGTFMTPKRARELLELNAEKDVLKGLKGSKNLLANSGYVKGMASVYQLPYLGAPDFPSR